MTLYNVHVYREIKLLYGGIEAASPEEAANKTRELDTGDADSLDDCDGETFAALVDVAGDEDYAQSRLIEFPPQQPCKAQRAAALLLDLIRYGLLSLEDGDACCDFNSTVYAFDDRTPDWQALVDAIGWDNAAAAIQATTAVTGNGLSD